MQHKWQNVERGLYKDIETGHYYERVRSKSLGNTWQSLYTTKLTEARERLDARRTARQAHKLGLKVKPAGKKRASVATVIKRYQQDGYHVTLAGRPAYTSRFLATFGFYESRAAVADTTGWFHVSEAGAALYAQRYAWCGNFQQGRVPVRDQAGHYYHLDQSGSRTYQEFYLYAGDYRDGMACVRKVTGLCTHIDLSGLPVHSAQYLDLDVFHKGFARARDRHGWFHVRLDGTPAYAARFADIEPFYNGQAFARTLENQYVLVSETGKIIHRILP